MAMRCCSGAPETKMPERITDHRSTMDGSQCLIIAWLQCGSALRLDGMLFQSIDRQAAQQLGIEIRGLLRQYLATKRDVTHLLHADRIHEERDICLAVAH